MSIGKIPNFCEYQFKGGSKMTKEYRTVKDIFKELAVAYDKLGKLLDELNRMRIKGENKK